MKKLIIVISAIMSFNVSLADEVKKDSFQCSAYEIVDAGVINALQDSLEADSLLEFRIDHIIYSDLSDGDMNLILGAICKRRYPSLNKAQATFGEAHYSYDEENKKVYSGKTFVAIIKSSLLGFSEAEIIIFWSNPSKREE